MPYSARPPKRGANFIDNTISTQPLTIITDKEIGRRVKKRRTELGISQKGLAEALSVTYQQVQRYENGTNRLNVEKIQLIARALSLPVSYFFESDETRIIAREEVKPYFNIRERKLVR